MGGRALLTLMALAFAALVSAFLRLSLPPSGWRGGEVVIPKGTSFRGALKILQEEGAVEDPSLLYLLGRLIGVDRRIKAGRYSFPSPLPPLELLAVLMRGSPEVVRVVVPEGSTLAEIASILEDAGVVSSREAFLRAARDPELLSRLGIEAPSLEGFLFPDTYLFAPDQDPGEVIGAMVENFRRHWGEGFSQRARELGLDPYQVLILASIIEKETSVPEERPLVAAVFHNRLRRGMALCADPTVIYGLGPDFKGDLTKEHLATPTPYNTYLRRGLPPTPICNPGEDSIRAALYPADVPYLYFVAKGDGTHHFSRTLEEHNRAVARFQLKRRR